MKIKKLPAGTTQAQWDRYEIAVKEHEASCEKRKPMQIEYPTFTDYIAAVNKWKFESLCDAPNEPGYFRANND